MHITAPPAGPRSQLVALEAGDLVDIQPNESRRARGRLRRWPRGEVSQDGRDD
jgi:hypothetical protein